MSTLASASERFSPWQVSWPFPAAGFSACRKNTMVSSARASSAVMATIATASIATLSLLVILPLVQAQQFRSVSVGKNQGNQSRRSPQAGPFPLPRETRRSFWVLLVLLLCQAATADAQYRID